MLRTTPAIYLTSLPDAILCEFHHLRDLGCYVHGMEAAAIAVE